MFTGIIEELGVVKQLNKRLDNLEITIETNFTPELKIDQSVAHNGICLTIVADGTHEVSSEVVLLFRPPLGCFKLNRRVPVSSSQPSITLIY